MNDDYDWDPDDPELKIVEEDDVVRLPVEEGVERLPRERPFMTGTPPPLRGPDQDGPEDAPDAAPVEIEDPEVIWEQGRRRRGPAPIGFIVLLGLLLVGTGVWAVVRISIGERRMQSEAEVMSEALLEEERKTMRAAKLLEVVEERLAKYLTAKSVPEKAAYVRHRERVQPLMVDFYRERPLDVQGYRRITQFYPLALDKIPFIGVKVELNDGRDVTLLAEQIGESEVKFDWESEVSYQPMPLEDFLAERPEEPMDFRMFAADDQFYAFEFADREKWRSLFLTVRDSSEYLFGYVERGTEVERKLDENLRGVGKRAVPMLLRIRLLPGSRSTRSVLVEEILAPRWAYLEDPAG